MVVYSTVPSHWVKLILYGTAPDKLSKVMQLQLTTILGVGVGENVGVGVGVIHEYN
jgi:hypothetical protein